MNQIQTFVNKEIGEIITVTIDNETWFVAKDGLAIQVKQYQDSKRMKRILSLLNEGIGNPKDRHK